MVKVAASILNCDHARIAEAVQKAEQGGADCIHVDVMDGVYCKVLTFGPGMVEGIKRACNVPVEVHLELADPMAYIQMFHEVGTDTLTFQADACPNPIHALRTIRQLDMKAGIGFGPSYDLNRLPYLLKHIDVLTLMSVEPGYGGQPFEENIYEKISIARRYMEETGIHVPIQVDGGVNDVTGPKLVDAGADVLITGTYIFRHEDIKGRVESLKRL